MNLKVGDIMTREPLCITPNTNLLDCAKKMVAKKAGSLIVRENNSLVGFVTQKEVLWALVKKSQQDLSQIKAIDVARKKIHTISTDTQVIEALRKMQRLKLERLPVVSNGKLVGIVTIKDILRVVNPELTGHLRQLLNIKEEARKLSRLNILGRIRNRNFMHEGMCEECGNYDILHKVDGRVICESCRDSM